MSKNFISQYLPLPSHSQPALWFIFNQDDILLCTKNTHPEIPVLSDISTLKINAQSIHYLGLYGETPCYTAEISKADTLPAQMQLQPLRSVYGFNNDENLFLIASRAKQILAWDSRTKFCGYCGSKTRLSDKERAKICNTCEAIFYPQISPVVMALICRENEILLARSPHFKPDLYSILAGFVEPGETLEQAVIREVKEEVGICVKPPQYFGSQPWPFPSNLMIGFIAEYDSGEIVKDPVEIEDAQWFKLDQLPQLPGPLSLAKRMIVATALQKKI